MRRTCAPCRDLMHSQCTKPLTCGCTTCRPVHAVDAVIAGDWEPAPAPQEMSSGPYTATALAPAPASSGLPGPPEVAVDPPAIPAPAPTPTPTAPVVRAKKRTPKAPVEPRKARARRAATPAPVKREKPTQPGSRPGARGPRPQLQKFVMPEAVRAGRRAYKTALKDGRTPTRADLAANREYMRLRWAQITPEQRALEGERSNRARSIRLGRPVRGEDSLMS